MLKKRGGKTRYVKNRPLPDQAKMRDDKALLAGEFPATSLSRTVITASTTPCNHHLQLVEIMKKTGKEW
jgi:hypothetical protein